jgi:RNA polymerase sigma factor (sigma-70 family)
MHDVSSHERQFIEALPHVDAVIRLVGRRYRLSADDLDELASRVRLRLVEDDYFVFRSFEGRSSLQTYLATVVTRLFLDERIRLWGKWRPSSEAHRLGPVAVALECLLTRDNLTPTEAIETLRSRDPACTDIRLRDLLSRLPVRAAARRLVDDGELAAMADPGPASDHLVVRDEARQARVAARQSLAAALDTLSPRDRLLLQLRYLEGCRVSDIARLLNAEQKPLYRHFDHLLGWLRRELEARGLAARHLDDLFSEDLDEEEIGVVSRNGGLVSVPPIDGATRPDSVAG